MAEVKLYARLVVVLYVFTAARLCYTDNGKLPSSREIVEVEKLLNGLNKPPVKSIKSPDGDIIDCVHISHQPAFDHPLLKNHTIKMRPSYDPNRINLDDVDVSSKMNTSKDGPLSSSITQLWHSNGKCPKGTIPIRRTKKQDVLRANSVKSYGKKKKSFSFAQPSFIDDEQLDVGARHEYAFASTHGKFYGTKAALNLWNPRVQESNEFSLTQTWIAAGTYDSGFNTIEAGWQSDAYQKTGCYNLCSGFIQINNKIAIGGPLLHKLMVLNMKSPYLSGRMERVGTGGCNLMEN
ncbi:hypothetical protein L1987_16401 [Smallanthus sonchifolius]|uniref:Uncharacterized protein n=1 Tax=Smallanthus sonchifolius TaxID=185202 RepID=A0ACB9J8M3_9ASTR|nr:hypothetical protein L1987_16401 [Smallanthus sonchifolius]